MSTHHNRAAFFTRFDGQGDVLALGDLETESLSDHEAIDAAIAELRRGGLELDEDGCNNTGRVELGAYTEAP